MHVSSKEVSEHGAHIITNVIEFDGAGEIASEKAKLSASVVSVSRTESGGVEVKTSVVVSEPVVEQPKAVEPEKVLSADEQALEFLHEQGNSDEDAKEALAKFGAARILAKRNAKLDEELDSVIS